MADMMYVVHNANGPVARCAFPEDAAALVSLHGDGAQVKFSRRTVWTEGVDGAAGDSYDEAAAVMNERIDEFHL